MIGGWYAMSIDTGLDAGRGTSERARGRGVGEGEFKSWRFTVEADGVTELVVLLSCCAVVGEEGDEVVGDLGVP